MRLKMIVFFVAAFCLFAVPSFAADITGTYEGEMAMPKMQGGGGPGGGGMGGGQMPAMKYIYKLTQEGTKLSGSVKGPFGPVNVFTDGKIEGDKISFSYKASFQGNEMTVKWDGDVKGDEITFTQSIEGGMGGPGGGGMPPTKVVAKKQK